MGLKAETETQIVRQCLDLLALRGIMAWRNNTTGVYDPKRGVFRTFTGRKGIADILAILKPDGKFFAIEVKKPGGKLTPEQKEFLDMICRNGGLSCVVRSVADLDAVLRLEMR